MEKDFSLNNPDIKKYFEGDDSYAPVRELMYLHTHPLIRPNFLLEIGNLIDQVGTKLVARKVPPSSKIIRDLESLCISLGQTLPDTEEAAGRMLPYLRDTYTICVSLNREQLT